MKQTSKNCSTAVDLSCSFGPLDADYPYVVQLAAAQKGILLGRPSRETEDFCFFELNSTFCFDLWGFLGCSIASRSVKNYMVWKVAGAVLLVFLSTAVVKSTAGRVFWE